MALICPACHGLPRFPPCPECGGCGIAHCCEGDRAVPEIREYPGYAGAFSKDQYPGALPNGSRIRKVEAEPGDANPIGARGTVLGSIGVPDVGIAYFVEWDRMPGVAVAVMAWKIGERTS